MRYLFLLICVPPFILGLIGFQFTFQKLEKMRQIRGFKPGAIVHTMEVRSKRQGNRRNEYWISVCDAGVPESAVRHLNLPAELWRRYQVGDTLELVFLPDGAGPYHREGIYASDGNFAVDIGLLLVESGMALLSLLGAGIGGIVLTRISPQAKAKLDGYFSP